MRVLDPACGSGNFLYVTLRLLKDLEHEAMQWGAERLRITGEFPQVGPHNVIGIEINPYAKELAGSRSGSARSSGCWTTAPASRATRCCSRSTTSSGATRSWPAAPGARRSRRRWPEGEAEFVVGNPPFLGK